MSSTSPFEIFLMAPPGLEPALRREAIELGCSDPQMTPGGVTFQGGWSDVWRANYRMRGAGRVLARIGSFHANHLAQLDKKARAFIWGEVLRADVPLRVDVTSKRSKIYHAKAAAERVERALTESFGATVSPGAEVVLKLRIEDDLCTFSVDTSGESLHKRGHKPAVAKAPMRETLAALFLRDCGFTGAEPVVDPMCGSGTFIIEAADWALGLAPGRSRHFAFEQLATFNTEAYEAIKSEAAPRSTPARFFGFDRDAGAVQSSQQNAARAGVADVASFAQRSVGALVPPCAGPGLVIVNPPYGARIGDRRELFSLYGTLGKRLMAGFSGWRVGVITSDAGLAQATGLPFGPLRSPVAHGGLKIRLFKTDPLP
ncbi:class I SAM-dependent RNA methyltransferase [Pseudoruegeria sp. SHC-113]|uniref:THUMP domain-containing class I SAM-dependent RNA methyltransferase n=1 Tax=Pseudoruegeria sp. SHC-113 TaxID=2855439 RepID=UPI0021BBAF6E|nr:class I SAM-dependent RNA methyltransferase [Pseudoruegeria sp. SHC-113]MCT8159444.1 class I SAM-dependent RNA methyltransferase [Pseudoruegeria sp. SHC-113]